MYIKKLCFTKLILILCLCVQTKLLQWDKTKTTFSKCECTGMKNKYRTFDGSFTNPEKPSWGKANTTFGRLLNACYANQNCEPRVSKSGKQLPGARNLSLACFPDKDFQDPIWTLLFMQFGQFSAHDLSSASSPSNIQCCTTDGQEIENAKKSPSCFNIDVSEDDPIRFRKENFTCMNFVRSESTKNCEQINAVSHVYDLSQVYGSSPQENKQLREGKGGRLLEGEDHKLPPAPAGTCPVKCPGESCYMTGDFRANQSPHLALIHSIFVREHNRIATYLAKLNPCWDDEKVFHETRRILIASYQYITFYEWMTILLGESHSKENKIVYDTKGYVHDFRSKTKSVTYAEYAVAAIRILHSTVAGNLIKVNEDRSFVGSIRLKDNFNCPAAISKEKDFCKLTMGLIEQHQMKNDQFHPEDITQFLNGATADLKALDIQRGRDHGLVTYNQVRQFCGLPRAEKFEDWKDHMTNESIKLLSTLYGCPDDVDLVVGLQFEKPAEGTFIGYTTRCIFTKQAYSLRKGDRFFFENYHAGFTIEQLNEIRKSSIARIICDNACSRSMSIQARAFEIPHGENKITSCRKIPGIDLSKWKDSKCSK